MGNKIARTTQVSASEYYLHDLPSSYNLVLKEVLGRGRFFKSILCKHDEGLVLVKVYFKRGDFIDLKEYERRLVKIEETFASIDNRHVWPFQFWQETDKAAYLVREYFFNNLHDRLSTRPFLSIVEKKWLAFQLLLAVKQSHEKNICHGDIKCENVLVTSWNWLYLADFASFKPTYIPYDDPSDFSFFFDTRGRRLCYLAPERFYEHGVETHVSQDDPLKPSMDIFAVGCVIAELFLEGQPLFELSQLLAYRRGQYDPSQHLEKIPDEGMRKMILHMIQLEPELRMSAESYLKKFFDVVFPIYFSQILHDFYCGFNPLPPDMRVVACQGIFPEMLKRMAKNGSIEENATAFEHKLILNEGPKIHEDVMRNGENLDEVSISERYNLHDDIGRHNTDAKERVSSPNEKVMLNGINNTGFSVDSKKCDEQSPNEFHHTISDAFQRNCHPFLKSITMDDLHTFMSKYDRQSDTFGMPFLPLPETNMRCEGMVLIASILCSCVRNIKLPHVRRGAILLLKSCSLYIDDEDRLQRVLPYIVAMLSDPAAIVRCAALETLCDILPLVRDFPPSDAKIFPEYIFPMLSMLPDDPEESVRICYARNLAKLAMTAYGFLIHSMHLREAGVLNELSLHDKSLTSYSETAGQIPKSNGDARLAQLRKNIAEVVQELVMGPKQTPNVRRALLEDIGNLCCFFGQRQSNDFLLPILPAFLNDRDEQLRAIFFEKIIYVCFFVGQRSVEEYLLPYIEQALSDVTEAVIVNALNCLSILCKSNFLRKRILLEMIEHAFPLLCYPSQWVRRSAVAFIAASSESLGPVDTYVFLAPVIRPFLRRQPACISSEEELLACLKSPVSKEVVYQVLEDARSSDMLDRQRKIWYNSSAQSKKWEAVDLLRSDDVGLNSMECWPDKQLCSKSQKPADSLLQQHQGLNECSGDDKLAESSSLKLSSGNTVDIQDPLFMSSMSPQLSSLNSFVDKASDGIPTYSFIRDKRSVGCSPKASEPSLQMNSLGIGSLSIPWVDPMSKSFNLASSIPMAKFASGSFSINSSSKHFYRVVHEPEMKEGEQATSVGGKYRDIGSSSSSKGSSVGSEDTPASMDVAGMPSGSRTVSGPDLGWKPRGVLIAHLEEHRSAVNDIAVSNEHKFFVTASDDSTVKVWDSRKLEKDISFRSKLTYHLEGSRALCATMLKNSPQVVVGACDGTMHTFVVDHIFKGLGNVIEKYSDAVNLKKRDSKEGAIITLLNHTANSATSEMLIYSTQNCGIHLLDIRTNTDAWTLRSAPEEGYVSSLVANPGGNWFISGSSRGVLTLWDLRFLIPVNSWNYSLVCPIEQMSLYVHPANVPPSSASRPLIYVAAGCNEVSLWDAENKSCHQVFRVANYENDGDTLECPWALARPSIKNNPKLGLRRNVNSRYRVEELNDPPPRLPGIRSILSLPGGDILTGGTDLKIRRWDHSRPERSYCVCGPNLKGVGNDDFYEIRSSFGVQVVQETKRRPLTTKVTSKAVLGAAATDSGGCHRDSIQSLASVKVNQRLLISSSRDGAVKVWK